MCSRNGMGLGAHWVMEREWGGRVCDQEIGLESGGEGVRVRTGCSEDEDAGKGEGLRAPHRLPLSPPFPSSGG